MFILVHRHLLEILPMLRCLAPNAGTFILYTRINPHHPKYMLYAMYMLYNMVQFRWQWYIKINQLATAFCILYPCGLVTRDCSCPSPPTSVHIALFLFSFSHIPLHPTSSAPSPPPSSPLLLPSFSPSPLLLLRKERLNSLFRELQDHVLCCQMKLYALAFSLCVYSSEVLHEA